MTNLRNYEPGSAAWKLAVDLSSRYDKNLALAAREVMVDAYTRATAGAAVDLTEVHTAQQLYEACGYQYVADFPGGPVYWHNGRASASALEVHHTATRRITETLLRRLDNATYGSLTEEQWEAVFNDMPGYLINKLDVREAAGPAHQALTTALNAIELGTDQNPRAIADIFQDIAREYTNWDPVVGPKVAQVAQAWLESRGIHP